MKLHTSCISGICLFCSEINIFFFNLVLKCPFINVEFLQFFFLFLSYPLRYKSKTSYIRHVHPKLLYTFIKVTEDLNNPKALLFVLTFACPLKCIILIIFEFLKGLSQRKFWTKGQQSSPFYRTLSEWREKRDWYPWPSIEKLGQMLSFKKLILLNSCNYMGKQPLW